MAQSLAKKLLSKSESIRHSPGGREKGACGTSAQQHQSTGGGVLLMDHPLPDSTWGVPLPRSMGRCLHTVLAEQSPSRPAIDGTLTEITLCISVAEQVQWREKRKHQPSIQQGMAKAEFKDQIWRDIYLIPFEIRQ